MGGIVLALLLLLASCGAASGSAVRLDGAYAPPGVVNEIEIAGDVTFLGGDFGVVAVDTQTGRLRRRLTTSLGPPIPPTLLGQSAVYALAARGARLYVGGLFSSINGVPRRNLAAFDLSTGMLDLFFDPGANERVLDLVADARRLYVGGRFTEIGGAQLTGLAALDPSSGAVDRSFVRLAPTLADLRRRCSPQYRWERIRSSVSALLLAGGRLIAGGDFGRVGGALRRHLAAIDTRTGRVDEGFRADANCAGEVVALSHVGSRLYVGGYIRSIGGRATGRLGAVGLRTGSPLRGFRSAFPTKVHSLHAGRDRLYVGSYLLRAADLRTGAGKGRAFWELVSRRRSSRVFALEATSTRLLVGFESPPYFAVFRGRF